jgi:hypothetical protein
VSLEPNPDEEEETALFAQRLPGFRSFGIAALLISLGWGTVGDVSDIAAQGGEGDAWVDLLDDVREKTVAATEDDLDSYVIDVAIDPASGTIAGTEEVVYRNSSGVPQDEVYFRLFPNAGYYHEGSLTVTDLTVDGQPADGELSASDTVLRVPLGRSLEPGASATVAMDFSTVVPFDSQGSFGILSRSSFAGTWVLSDWYPSLAGYEPDRGWRIDPPTAFGDPTFSETALYDVTISAPAAWTLVTSGTDVAADPDGAAEARRFIAGPARDFSFVADDDYVAVEAMAGDTTVTAFVNPGEEAAGQSALDVAVSAITLYGSWFGPYPYQELDIVAAPLAGALGVSWAGLIQLDGPGLLGVLAPNDPTRFASIVAHEVGHQWWGSLVGFNSNDHTFLLEGLTNYVAILWIEATAGQDTALAAMRASLAAPYIALLESTGDQVADLPIADGQSGRSTIYYAKSSLGFFAIDETIGDDAFRAALSGVAGVFGFGVAEPLDVLTAFEAASGQDLDGLWRFWFEAAETTPADVEALFV